MTTNKTADTDQQNTGEEQPAYIDILGLKSAPFSNQWSEGDSDFYFNEPSRTKALDMLLHLTQDSDLLLKVSAPKGSGKTVLIQQFVNKASENLSICVVTASPGMNEQLLINSILEGYKIDLEDKNQSEKLNKLYSHLESMARKSITSVLIIDDFHHLDDIALILVKELITQLKDNDGKDFLRSVLIGEQKIDDQVASLELDNRVKNIDFPSFSVDETEKYIRHRLSTSGNRLDYLFKRADVKKIHKQSTGVPAHINALAYQFLLKEAKAQQIPVSKSEKLQFSESQRFNTIITVIIIGIILVFHEDADELFQPSVQDVLEISIADKNFDAAKELNALQTFEDERVDKPKDESEKESKVTQIKEDSEKIFVDEINSEDKKVEKTGATEPKLEAGKKDIQKPEKLDNKKPDTKVDKLESAKRVAPIKSLKALVPPRFSAKSSVPKAILNKRKTRKVLQVINTKNKKTSVVAVSVAKKSIIKPLIKKVELGDLNKKTFEETHTENNSPTNVSLLQKPLLEPAENNNNLISKGIQNIGDKEHLSEGRIDKKKLIVYEVDEFNDAEYEYDDAPMMVVQSVIETPLIEQNIRQESWILAQNEHLYTIQLFTSEKEASILNFLDMYRLSEEKAAYFRSNANKKNLYSLLYGVYSDRSSAKRAVKKLPKNIAKEAWIRNLNSVQSEIDKVNDE